METIRALSRGLEVLQLLNRQHGATVTEVAASTGLARTTANRMLDTLIEDGFVARDPVDGRYRPTLKVRTLSDGFQDEVWVRDIALPLIHELSAKVIWPVAIASPFGTSMLVRGTTDAVSPLALERYSAGYRVPIAVSASGLVYLSTLPDSQQKHLLDVLMALPETQRSIPVGRSEIEELLRVVPRQGYCWVKLPENREAVIGVPVMVEGRYLASMILRHMIAAMTIEQAVRRYLPDMKATADEIGRRVARFQAQTGESIAEIATTQPAA